MTSDMVFSSLFLIIHFLLLLFVELPSFHVVFRDLNLPKAGPQDVRFFDCFSSCGAEIEIAVTKTNCC